MILCMEKVYNFLMLGVYSYVLGNKYDGHWKNGVMCGKGIWRGKL